VISSKPTSGDYAPVDNGLWLRRVAVEDSAETTGKRFAEIGHTWPNLGDFESPVVSSALRAYGFREAGFGRTGAFRRCCIRFIPTGFLAHVIPFSVGWPYNSGCR